MFNDQILLNSYPVDPRVLSLLDVFGANLLLRDSRNFWISSSLSNANWGGPGGPASSTGCCWADTPEKTIKSY